MKLPIITRPGPLSLTILWITFISVWALPALNGAATASEPAERAAAAREVNDLKQRLEKGLRAQRPEDFKFVALVVTMVGNDTLPLKLVTSTFLWARKKGVETSYPFPYFERALRIRAAKQGIKIP